MNAIPHGPLVSDAEFFTQCLKTDLPALRAVQSAAERSDWAAARKTFGAFVRALPTPSGFFDKTW